MTSAVAEPPRQFRLQSAVRWLPAVPVAVYTFIQLESSASRDGTIIHLLMAVFFGVVVQVILTIAYVLAVNAMATLLKQPTEILKTDYFDQQVLSAVLLAAVVWTWIQTSRRAEMGRLERCIAAEQQSPSGATSTPLGIFYRCEEKETEGSGESFDGE